MEKTEEHIRLFDCLAKDEIKNTEEHLKWETEKANAKLNFLNAFNEYANSTGPDEVIYLMERLIRNVKIRSKEIDKVIDELFMDALFMDELFMDELNRIDKKGK